MMEKRELLMLYKDLEKKLNDVRGSLWIKKEQIDFICPFLFYHRNRLVLSLYFAPFTVTIPPCWAAIW